MGINRYRPAQKNGPNWKLLRSIVSPQSAQSAQSTTDQCRETITEASAISTNISMGFATITTIPISSQSNYRRRYRNKLVATWMLMSTPAIKSHMKSKQIRDLSGSRSNISGQITPKSSKSKANSAEKT